MSSAGIDTVKHSEANISDNEEIDETSLFSAANHAIIKSDYENAKIHLLKLIKAGPYKSKYYGMLGYVYENLGDVPKSLQMRFTAANLMKQNCPSSNWVKIAEQCEENNLYPLLEQCYDKLMKLFPNDRFIALKRIRNLRKMGKSPKTVSVYGDILEYTKDKDILIEGLNLCLGKNYFPKKYYEKTRYFKQINPVTSNIVAEDVILSNIESPKSFKKREKIDDLIEIDIDQPVENSKKAKICDNKMDENFERNELFNEELENFDFGNDEMIETNAPMSLPEDFENELFGDVRMLDDLRQFDNFDLPISKEENFKNLNFKENQNFETNKILQNENLAETKKTKPENPRRKAMYLIEKYFGFNKKMRKFKMDFFEIENITCLCEIYVEQREFLRCRNFLNSIPSSDLKFLPREVWVNKAISLIHLSQFEEIDKILRKCGLFEQPNEEHLFLIGAAFMHHKKSKEAQKYLKPLENSVRYKTPRFWYLFGFSYYLLENFEKAKFYFNKVLEWKGNPGPMDHESELSTRVLLSKIYKKMGDNKKAIEILKIAENVQFLSQRSNVDISTATHKDLTTKRLFKKLNKRVEMQYNRESERYYLFSKIQLLSKQIRKMVEQNKFDLIVENTKEAIDDVLNAKIHPKQLFSADGFMEIAVVLVQLWRQEKYKNERKKSLLKLCKMAAWYLGTFNSDDNFLIVDIALVGAKEYLKEKMFVKSYFCIRPVLLRRQYDIDAASLFGQILHKSNYNLNITRCLIRLSAAYPKNFFFSYLRGFCSIHRRCYGNAVNFFMKNHTVNDVPTDLCLYVGSCYLMQSKKRTCPNKEKIKLIGNTFIRKYRRRKHKNAMSTLNLAETLLFQGRKAEAFCMFEKVLRSKDFEMKDEKFINPCKIKQIPFMRKYKRGRAYKIALKRISELEDHSQYQ